MSDVANTTRWKPMTRTIVVFVLWGLVIAVALWVYLFSRLGIGGRFGEHWQLLIPLALVALMVSGQLGAGYGVPSLFRDSPDGRWWNFWRSLFSGFGVGLLILTVTISIYFAEFIYHFDRVEENWDQWSKHWATISDSNKDFSFWDVVRNPARIMEEGKGGSQDKPRELILGSDPDLGTVLMLRVFGPLKLRFHIRTLAAFVFQFWASLPLLLMFGVCVVLPTPDLARRVRPPGSRPIARWWVEKVGYTLGGLTAIAVGYLFGEFVPRLNTPMELLGDLHTWSVSRFSSFDGDAEVARHAVQSIGGFILMFALTFSAILLLPGRVPIIPRRISPGLGICLVLNLACLAYLFLISLAPDLQILIVVGFVGYLLVVNSRPFKYRYRGLERYYNSPPDSENTYERGPKELDHEELRIQRGDVTDVLPSILLSDRETLEAWGRRHTRDHCKPRLVLVTTTGGAYRASFWTTTVLEELSDQCPQIMNHTRLITGASGGMVGAAYAVALLNAPKDTDPYSPTLRQCGEGPTQRLEEESDRDSLTPVAERIIKSDLWNGLFPFLQGRDRGDVLEEQWTTLQIPFSELREGEREGWRPSMILSPMVVETGRRLLFSNLDVFGLTEARNTVRSDVSYIAANEEDSKRLLRDQESFELGEWGGKNRLYSRSAVEFFRAFPAAYGLDHNRNPYPDDDQGDEFTVATAVRMNANFPYLSPATSLPVKPIRRGVDAGYYDNYGVDLATNWALQNRDWIKNHTSGIALIQIRASQSEVERKRIWTGPPIGESESAVAWMISRLTQGLHALTTPPSAAFSALGSSMAYRNDLLVAELDQVFNEGTEKRFFETFIFENPIPFGMNWFVTNHEIRLMEQSMRDDGEFSESDSFRNNHRQKKAFLSWFGNGSAVTY